MIAVAIEILGEPNKEFSTKTELRFGSRGALSVDKSKGTWCDHSDGDAGGGVLDFLRVKKGFEKPDALEWLRERKHLPQTEQSGNVARIVATYDYLEANGTLLFQVVRKDPKAFLQRRPKDGGGWEWSTKGMQLVLYRLPEVAAAVAAGRTIYVAEGEKGVDALARLGVTATCSPRGAGKWKPEYSPSLAGTDVVILPDADDPGEKHATHVSKALAGVAKSIRVLRLPGLPHKGDVVDWIVGGGTREALEALVKEVDADTASAEKEHPRPYISSLEPLTLNGDPLTEDSLALAFTAEHADSLRYDHTRGAWFQWSGKAWRQDETRLAFSWARRTCRKLAMDAHAEGKALLVMAKAATAAAVERFAQSDPTLAVTSAIWDCDSFLLGTPGGTLDLETGELRKPSPDDHITRLTAVAPAVSSECPLWLKFLEEATNQNADLIRFLRQWCGYCLTGDTREHALMFAHGEGGNGKGVFLNTVAHIFGDYARNAPMDTFVASSGDRHPTDLAMLRGARLVTASETEDGRAWAEARIKSLTGGDKITARFMRRDFFEFQPEFKLLFIGNHRPVLRNVDEAARRRFNLVPFTNKPIKKDLELEAKLRAEWPAILRWMIEGCLDWQKNGLVRPKAVTEATAAYFSEQDLVRQWVEDCCDNGGTNSDTLAALFRSWSDFAIANGEKMGTTKWFSQTLARLGYDAIKNTPQHHGKRGFKGIAVKLPPVRTPRQDEAQDRRYEPPD